MQLPEILDDILVLFPRFGFKAHRDIHETRVIDQSPEEFKAEMPFADMLVTIDP